MKQSQAFIDGEGEAWLKRNESKLGATNDPALLTMEKYGLKPKKVLEIGCANGWRLEILRRAWGCRCEGVEPGADLGETRGTEIWPGTADNMPYCYSADYDTVIYGWCLYLCDPEDYFRIVSEGDRVLADGGKLVIYDFLADFPYKNKYKHREGIFSHKMDFSKLWLSHPGYSLYGRDIFGEGDNQTTVTILHKNMKNAFSVKS